MGSYRQMVRWNHCVSTLGQPIARLITPIEHLRCIWLRDLPIAFARTLSVAKCKIHTVRLTDLIMIIIVVFSSFFFMRTYRANRKGAVIRSTINAFCQYSIAFGKTVSCIFPFFLLLLFSRKRPSCCKMLQSLNVVQMDFEKKIIKKCEFDLFLQTKNRKSK